MRLIYLLGIFTIIIACSSPSYQKDQTEDKLDKQKDSIKLVETKQLESIKFITPKTRFIHDGYDVFVIKGEDTLVHTKLTPSEKIDHPEYPDMRKVDEVTPFHDNFILITRGMTWLGDFCHFPSIDSIELYDKYGKRHTYNRKEVDYLMFNGNREYFEAKRWYLLISEGEGDIFGYGVLDSNAIFHKVALPDTVYTGFFEDLSYEHLDTSILISTKDSLQNFKSIEIFGNGSFMIM